jgi:hypothetical protein
LPSGHATGADRGCAERFAARVEAGEIFVDVPETAGVLAEAGADVG